jgi:hypothetical protein
MRTFRILPIITVLAFAYTCLCGETNVTAQLEAIGGADKLKQECNGFINIYSESGGSKFIWTAKDTNFPPAIAAFHPQSIRIRTQGTAAVADTRGTKIAVVAKEIRVYAMMVDLRLTNGPPERGLIVAIPNIGKLPPDFMPLLGTNYTVRVVTNGVFQYHD